MTSYPSWLDLFPQNVSLPPDQGASLPPSVGPIYDPVTAALRAQRLGTPEGASTYPFAQDLLRFLVPNSDWVDQRPPQGAPRWPDATRSSSTPTATNPWPDVGVDDAENVADVLSASPPNAKVALPYSETTPHQPDASGLLSTFGAIFGNPFTEPSQTKLNPSDIAPGPDFSAAPYNLSDAQLSSAHLSRFVDPYSAKSLDQQRQNAQRFGQFTFDQDREMMLGV
jgi:hypothetical protein